MFQRDRKNSQDSFLSSLSSDIEDTQAAKPKHYAINRTCSVPDGVAGFTSASEQYQMEGKSVGTTSTTSGFQNLGSCRKYSEDSRAPSNFLSFHRAKRIMAKKEGLTA